MRFFFHALDDGSFQCHDPDSDDRHNTCSYCIQGAVLLVLASAREVL